LSKINQINVDGAVYDIEDKSVPGWAKGVDKPTYKTSELENDNNFVTEAQMNERISNIEISGGVDLSVKTNTSVLPNDHGDIKTRYRICNKSEDESPVVYFPLVKLPTDNSKNRASVILRGRIGGYLPGDMAMVDALIWNRTETGISLLNINADSFSLDEPLRVCDIVVYTNEDDTDTVYLKCKEYFVFDINMEVYQDTAQILYDGTYLTEAPSGTLSAAASTSNKRVEIYNGKLYINGNEIGGSSGNSNESTVLYDNESGSFNAIALNDDIENYKFVEIYYIGKFETSGDNYCYTKMFNPTGKQIDLSSNTCIQQENAINLHATIKMQGKSLTWSRNFMCYTGTGTYAYAGNSSNCIRIVKIIGIK
jgi:hypothetical protein